MFKNSLLTIRKINNILTGKQKRSIIFLFLLMLASALIEAFGISLIIPYFSVLTNPDAFFSGTIGNMTARTFHISTGNDILILLTILLIIAFGVKYMLSYVIRLKQTNFVNRNRLGMAQRVMQHLMKEDYESHLYRNVTEEINLVTTHVTWVFELIGAALSFMIQALNVLALGIFVLIVDTRITLIFGTGITILYLTFHKVFRKKVQTAGEEANKTWEEYDKIISESFLLKKENAVFKRNDAVFEAFNYYGKRNVKADENKMRYNIIPGLITNLISVWAILFFVLFTLSSGNNIAECLGKLSALYLAITRIIPGVNSIYSCTQQISFYRPSLDKVHELLTSIDNTAHTEALNHTAHALHDSLYLSDISFRYRNSNHDILEHIDLHIARGERIGIVGKTGSGKTTLINLIIGLLKPVSGHIYIDGAELPGCDILDVGYVPQDTNLLDSTLRENIVFGRDVPEHKLAHVVDASGLREFVDQLPHGLETKIGAQGMRISGGQRQRIGIARALIGSPSILIFDEPTSSLDLKTEQEIIRTIQTLGRDTTVIMISHRSNTLQFCDRWFCIQGHQLREMPVWS